MRIIDCHCHAGRGDGLTGPWDTDAPLGPYLEWADEAGIGQTVLFSAFHSDYAVANRAVGRLVRRQPERFFGFAFVHAERDQGRVEALVGTAVRDYGFRGIKVHRYDARISREICAAARRYRLPVLYDVAGEIAVVGLLAEQYPDVNFIIPHLGSFSDDWRAQAGLIDYLVRCPNIYADTSGVRRFDILRRAFERAGPAKFLFGSDGPWLHPGVELAKIKALHLPRADAEQVLAGTLLRLLGPAQPLLPATEKPVAALGAPRPVVAAAGPAPWRDPWLIGNQ